MSNITLVTGIWDIGRGDLSEGWSRSYQHYLDKFEQLLKVEENLIIFGDSELKSFVFERRNPSNTQFIERPLSWFTNSEFFPLIQKIRTNPEWYNQSGWLKESTQGRLENYNPLVMSKMFLLHDAKIMDQFNSEYMFIRSIRSTARMLPCHGSDEGSIPSWTANPLSYYKMS